MNPFCPNCIRKGEPGKMNDSAVRLVTRIMSTGFTQETLIKKIKGLLLRRVMQKGGIGKYWFCKRCKSRWLKGGELIQKK